MCWHARSHKLQHRMRTKCETFVTYYAGRGVASGVWGVGCGMWDVECGVWCVGCGVLSVECGCRVWDMGCEVWVWGMGCNSFTQDQQ